MFIGVPLRVGVVIVGAVAVFLLRFLFDATLAPRLASSLSIRGPKKLAKFNENAFNALFYTISFYIGATGLFRSGWIDLPMISSQCAEAIPSFATDWGSPFVKLYYVMAASYYLQAAVTSITIDTQRKDRWVMFTHHLVTLALVAGSSYIGLFRAGLLTLLIHDISDILLYTAKVVHYAKSPWNKSLFYLFGVSFICLRLVGLPFITYACMCQYRCDWDVIYLDLGSGWLTDGTAVFNIGPTAYTLFGLSFTNFGTLIAFLLVLICMHAWWATIIFKMAFGNATQDERSDDEEEEEEEEEAKNK